MDARFAGARTALSAWFAARSPRERWMLAALAAACMGWGAYSGLWAPAFDGIARIRSALPVLEQQLAQMQMQGQVMARLRAASLPGPSGAGLRDALATSLARGGIRDAQAVVAGNTVRIEAHNASFAAWIAWVDRVRVTERARLVETRLTGEAERGRVTVSALFEPASSP
ncbi:type II secretion system protein GspM [Trinickia caryophylli]|uniref:General secretion pathway protein M n=1 Tax=Trinickia caryophylli TaxID=28094 RepID=A0A1X7H5C2_TRICW|nr:type II secretion system protein GspM [Trinickia caryophylli]PMS09625.1 type II secretion system protein M [Trinickia caryophylli]TRX17239.1 type II secretion system protein M [Trinickia caryophylli]WQE12027.1 type II secretion system protein GspM [Trinickia caryophylli]SMF79796.1 general secretion pathway protein M [Trinickia caryophylli]GLU35579.1 hypothetical protein Busp01_54210 [Trinickia caryophylli]